MTKKEFKKLAKKHLTINEKQNLAFGRKLKYIDGIEELYKAMNFTRCCKSDSEQLPDVYLQELSKVEWTQQTQASLNEQLQILRQFANKLGLYDASDYLKK